MNAAAKKRAARAPAPDWSTIHPFDLAHEAYLRTRLSSAGLDDDTAGSD
jgi:hypothetical protein